MLWFTTQKPKRNWETGRLKRKPKRRNQKPQRMIWKPPDGPIGIGNQEMHHGLCMDALVIGSGDRVQTGMDVTTVCARLVIGSGHRRHVGMDVATVCAWMLSADPGGVSDIPRGCCSIAYPTAPTTHSLLPLLTLPPPSPP